MKIVQVLLCAQLVAGVSANFLDWFGNEIISEVSQMDAEIQGLVDDIDAEEEHPGRSLVNEHEQPELDLEQHQDERKLTCYGLLGASATIQQKEDWCHTNFGEMSEPEENHYCYNDYQDCYCPTGNKWVNGMCVNDPNCSNDPAQHCMDIYGQFAMPENGKSCYDTETDCTCKDGFDVVNGECQGCGELWWICRDFYGPNAAPIVDQGITCYNDPSHCTCLEGYYLHEGYCVDDCPDGTHPIGDKCVKDVSGHGDPHFITFHGHEFEFHGECDLVLLKAPAMDMDIHVRTTIRYDYSFISQVAVRIGEHIFEVASWGEYMLDGISTPELPAFMEGYPITVQIFEDSTQKYKFVIHLLRDRKAINIVSFKDYVGVNIAHSDINDFYDASGLMGHFESGDMLARNGRTAMDEHPNEYGMEWQVRPEEDGQLFSAAREPQYPNHRCKLPSASAIHARKLGEASVTQEEAESLCAHVDTHKASCIKDVIRSQDPNIAGVYE